MCLSLSLSLSFPFFSLTVPSPYPHVWCAAFLQRTVSVVCVCAYCSALTCVGVCAFVRAFGMAWCGVVWRGMVWCGVVWCGVEWWRGVVWCGVVCGVCCGVVWCGMVWCGIAGFRSFSGPDGETRHSAVHTGISSALLLLPRWPGRDWPVSALSVALGRPPLRYFVRPLTLPRSLTRRRLYCAMPYACVHVCCTRACTCTCVGGWDAMRRTARRSKSPPPERPTSPFCAPCSGPSSTATSWYFASLHFTSLRVASLCFTSLHFVSFRVDVCTCSCVHV